LVETLTFLFTDIEGSTAGLVDPEVYRIARVAVFQSGRISEDEHNQRRASIIQS